ncbi:hypothetical protein [Roseibacillus persicicus]|uniref:Uncharacterized protein n=1 Tax=Roseibacillus persicicus TaxID=454148 RepID=A0A918WGI8_9BACT|nr:hypothetical protein [Roseibacillus persicicus]GHC45534.1 hypothetical protein GCM10007100_08630 [Roseibacillus persicicus]
MKTKLLSLLLMTQTVFAIDLERGESETLEGVGNLTHPEFTGNILQDKLIPFEIKDSLGEVILTGNYHSRVFRSNSTGKLVFAGRVRDTSNPDGTFGWVTHVRLQGFGFVDVDAEAALDSASAGSVRASRASRNVAGDVLSYTIGPGLLNPPDESTFFFAGTQAESYTEDGRVTIFASNDFGGNSFSVELEGTLVPVKPPLCLELGERFFFETSYYYPIDVTGVAKGVQLRVETSPDLTAESWSLTSEPLRTVTGEITRAYGEVYGDYDGKQFFRVVCSLPEEGR